MSALWRQNEHGETPLFITFLSSSWLVTSVLFWMASVYLLLILEQILWEKTKAATINTKNRLSKTVFAINVKKKWEKLTVFPLGNIGKTRLTTFVSKFVWGNQAESQNCKNSPTQPALKRSVSNLDAVILRSFFELLLWMNVNKIINREVIFWIIYSKTSNASVLNEIRFTIPA